MKITYEDLLASLPNVRPSAMREITLEVPHVKWTDIGGQDEIKARLREAVEWPIKVRKKTTRDCPIQLLESRGV